MLPVPPGHVRAGPLQCIPLVLRERGADPGPVFQAARVDPALFSDSENTVAYTDVYRLMAASSRAARCSHFGLLVGSRCKVEHMGIIGLLAAQAPNLGLALRDFADHIALFDTVTKISLGQQDGEAHLHLTLPDGDSEGTIQAVELIVTIAVRVLRELAGPGWGPKRVLLGHALRGPIRPYIDFFQAPLIGDAVSTGVAFEASWLDQPLQGSAVLRRYLESYVAILKDAADVSLAGRVSQRVRAAPTLRNLTEPAVARSMGMESSALRRRLARENTSYRQILESAYRDRAQHLMGTPELKLSQIATMLGFAELSVFTRAFRRWTGMTPTQWRRTAMTAEYAPPDPPIRLRS
jgi:AraC-like DNA-binding protein